MTTAPAPLPGIAPRTIGRTTLRWAGIMGLLAFLVAPMVPLFIWSISFRWFYPDILPSEYSARAWEQVISPHQQRHRRHRADHPDRPVCAPSCPSCWECRPAARWDSTTSRESASSRS